MKAVGIKVLTRALSEKTPSLNKLKELPRPKKAIDYASAWDNVTTRLSSNLRKIECIIGIRRAGRMQDLHADDEWITHRLDMVEQYFNGINFKIMDALVEETVRDNSILADCRALDAIHFATALYFKPHLGSPLYICSLDKRMRATAVILGFPLYPEDN
jgi:hypothetical protein